MKDKGEKREVAKAEMFSANRAVSARGYMSYSMSPSRVATLYDADIPTVSIFFAIK